MSIQDSIVEIKLKTEEDFLKVRETLTRIGVASARDRKLYQSCHILHKQGRYYIVHFKELFVLDGKPSTLTDDDIGRRNTIANLICEWGLVEIVDKQKTEAPVAPMSQVKVIPYRDKDQWELVAKYNIGRKI